MPKPVTQFSDAPLCDANRLLRLENPQAMEDLGRALATVLEAGDSVLLSGDLGAGKSVLARAIIGTRLALDDRKADVPSPSYTLVNVYETSRGAIWHADLYRLSGEPEEIEELGLTDAFETSLTLVEWPERLGALTPERHLRLALEIDGEARDLTVSAAGMGWDAALAVLQEFAR